MKFKHMHLAGPTAAVSALGLGLLFVTRLTSPNAVMGDSLVDPKLWETNYELSENLYRFPESRAKLRGGERNLSRLVPRNLSSASFALLSPEGFATSAPTRYVTTFVSSGTLETEALDERAYVPSFSRSGLSAGFAGGAIMGSIGAGVVATSYRTAAFPASIAASSSLADGATIAASLPEVATSADLTSVGSAAVNAASAPTTAAAALTDPALPSVASGEPVANASSSDPAPLAPSVERTPVRNVVQAVASNAWVYDAIPEGERVRPGNVVPRGPVLTSSLPNLDLWVPPVRPADIITNTPAVAGLPAGLQPLVTPEPASMALLGAGLAVLAFATRRRKGLDIARL